MEIVLWFVGVMAMWTALKFVFMVFKRLGSKNSMNDLIDKMEDGMQDAADNVASGFKSMKEKRRQKKEQPVVIIH